MGNTLLDKLAQYLEFSKELSAVGVEGVDTYADTVRVSNELYINLFGETEIKPYTPNYDQMYRCIGRLKIMTMVKKKRPGSENFRRRA